MKRREAEELGLKTYITGKQCKNGHRSERYTDKASCIECTREASKRWTKRHPDRIRKGNIYRKFGISLEEYDKLLSKQDGVCAVCNNFETGNRSLAVDHNHDTSKIRGLLCGNCNRGIGHLQDSILILRKAIKYLERY